MTVNRRFLAAALLMLFPICRPAIAATIGFEPAVNYAVGTAPATVAVADFNGDGHVDLAVANNGNAGTGDDGNVSILLGNDDGTFQAAVDYPAGKNPRSVAAGDFNGDGRKDLVVASSSSPTVSVLLGNGDGTFQTPVDSAAGLYPDIGRVVVGDFNGDNKLDLALFSGGLNHPVTVLLGNGDGSFQSAVDYPLVGLPHGLVAADLNGDGNLDLAVALGVPPPLGPSGGVAVLLGTGNGSFAGATLVSAIPSLDVAVGDFNGDGHPDLVARRLAFETSLLLLNNGDGTFGPGSSVRVGRVVGDFDGDGKLDLAGFAFNLCLFTGCDPNHRLAVLPGNGDGTFQPEVSFSGNIDPFLAADLDGNKSPDLVTVNSDNTISVLLNTVGTDFSIAASAASPATVSRGQSSTSTVTLHLLNAFDNPVALACSVQPAQAGSPTCSLNPNSVTFDASGNATAMLTINTGAAVGSLALPDTSQNPWRAQLLWLPVTGFALLGAGLGRGGARRRKLLNLLASGIMLAGLILQTGCGGGASSSNTNSGPSSQTYTVTVTGTSGSTQHSTTVTLAVQ